MNREYCNHAMRIIQSIESSKTSNSIEFLSMDVSNEELIALFFIVYKQRDLYKKAFYRIYSEMKYRLINSMFVK